MTWFIFAAVSRIYFVVDVSVCALTSLSNLKEEAVVKEAVDSYFTVARLVKLWCTKNQVFCCFNETHYCDRKFTDIQTSLYFPILFQIIMYFSVFAQQHLFFPSTGIVISG